MEVKRLVVAFAAFAALAVLAYETLPDARVRAMTFAILALFATRTWLRRREIVHSDEHDDSAR